MKNLIRAGLLIFAVLFTANAEDINKIMEKAHLAAYYAADDGSAQLLMKVYPKGSDNPIKKMFYMLRDDVKEGGEQYFYTYFSSPSDISRTTFLVNKFVNKDDSRRLYIPSSDKVLRIAGSRKQDPFMGSDFTYEDVSGRHFTRDNHKLLGSETIKGEDVYLTESIPKPENAGDDKYSRLKAWISKKSYIPLKVEFYGKNNELLRVYESEQIQDIDGYPTILKRVMTSPKEGTKTVILVNPKSVKYNLGLDESIFSERSLKNPPVEYFK